jgi:hypothetical protein
MAESSFFWKTIGTNLSIIGRVCTMQPHMICIKKGSCFSYRVDSPETVQAW